MLTPFLILSVGKMYDLSVKEQKKLMLEARTVMRVTDQSVTKSDMSDFKIWLLKKRKAIINKEIPKVLEPQSSTISPLKSLGPSL